MRIALFAMTIAIVAAGAPAGAAPPSVGGCQILPADNYWNTPVDHLPVHPSSAAWVASIGNTGFIRADWGNVLADNYGIPFTTVTGAQAPVPIVADPDPDLDFSDESDPGPYPIPPAAPIEGGPASAGDRHVIVIETTNCILYELYRAYPLGGGTSWQASSFAKFPLNSNALRTDGWTSGDAAGLPIFPGLVRWEEVAAGEINHAIRFTAALIWGRENNQQKYLWPARHASGTSTVATRPPMGARLRLKAAFDISPYSEPVKVILRAMKKYGIVLADAGSNWYFSGVSSTSWPDSFFSELHQTRRVLGSNFEVVDTAPLRVSANSGQAIQPSVDLALALAPVPATVGTGRDIVYTATVTNLGSGAASGVAITHALPAGTGFIWASPGCTHAAGTVTCALGLLGGGAGATAKIVARPGAAGALVSTATVSTSSVDVNMANNAATANVTALTSPAASQVLRYRLFSPVTKEHLYTTDLNEYNVLAALTGTWNAEGTVGKVLDNPGSFGGVTATPYYRLYNTANLQHHWTTDANEYYTLAQFPQYSAEGVDGWILPTQAPGSVPLYRLLYPFTVPVAGLHHWTIDANEYGTLIAAFGWVGEGGSGFVIP